MLAARLIDLVAQIDHLAGDDRQLGVHLDHPRAQGQAEGQGRTDNQAPFLKVHGWLFLRSGSLRETIYGAWPGAGVNDAPLLVAVEVVAPGTNGGASSGSTAVAGQRLASTNASLKGIARIAVRSFSVGHHSAGG